ncbi:MAG: molybdopterin molybdotransferase MoeA [Planctomycetes bacterium]|nr:molybdopterin molybdotransferase MoeA [Planctomycetota bacterium]
MICVEEAEKIVLDSVTRIDSEEVRITEAYGRTIAETVMSDDDIPCYDNSAMDGYAVRKEDVASASQDSPVELELIEEIPAGTIPQKTVEAGTAIKIMTGAPIPEGADAIVILEDTESDGSKVKVLAPVTKDHIRPKGEDIAAGSRVIEDGTLLRSQEIGMLASVGRQQIKVARRPRVAILSTGDEVIPHDQPLERGKVRNSNAFTLRGLIQDAGAVPIDLGIAKDTKNELRRALKRGLNADLLITSGGVSVGEYDFVKDALEEVGMELKYWKVQMKPGKPSVFGTIGKTLAFGLPGNPVSVMVGFEVFVRPAILKMMGRKEVRRPLVHAILDDEKVKHKGKRRSFVCGRVRVAAGAFHVTVRGPQGSGMLRSMSRANALLVLPKDTPAPQKGDTVSVLLLDNPRIE